MRLIHTGDIHLDACFAAGGMPGRVANRRRQSLRDVLHAILARAVAWPADAVLIAGDLFDLERVSRDTVAFLRNEFEAVRPMPILIVPGNHDPYVNYSPYATEAWSDNVTIFARPIWEAKSLLNGALVIHGFGFDGFDISINPFGTLTVPQDGAVHVALGHGTENKHQPPDGKSYAPFDANVAAAAGLAYFALGHFHAATEVTGDLGVPMWYAGAPEGHGFDEPGPRVYLEIEIEGGATRIDRVPSSRVEYLTVDIDCSGFSSSQQLVDALRGIAAPFTVPPVARARLQGACAAAVSDEFTSACDAVAPLFEHLVLQDETSPVDDFEDLARENTTLGMFVQRLNAAITDAPDDERRALLNRSREVGLAAYRNRKLAIRGLDMGGTQS